MSRFLCRPVRESRRLRLHRRSCLAAATILSSTPSSAREFICNISMLAPRGAVSTGFESAEKRTTQGQLLAATMCIGPVSLPIAMAAPRASATISSRLVWPSKFRAAGTASAIAGRMLDSDLPPRRTGVQLCALSQDASAIKFWTGQRLAGRCGAPPGTRSA